MKVKIDKELTLEIDDRSLDDFRLVEALTDVDKGKLGRLTDALDILLGNAKPVLFEHIEKKKGYLSTEEVKNALLKIFEEMKAGKKS